MMREKLKINIYALSGMAMLILFTGCFLSWAPSDAEAVSLLKDYYAFYEAKEIEVTILERQGFLEECTCYPVEFRIAHGKNRGYKEVFYFYKNGTGKAEIRKFKFGIKNGHT